MLASREHAVAVAPAPGARTAAVVPARSVSEIRAARIGRDTAVYAAGILVNRLAAFVMLPVYSRYLAPADYGVIQLVEMTLDFISILAGAKLAQGVFRYYHTADSDAERRSVASTSLVLICGAYLVVSATVLAAAAPLSQLVFRSTVYAPLLRIAAIGLATQSLLVVPLAFARVRGRSDIFVAANTTLLLLQLGLNVLLLVHFRLGPAAVFLSNVIASSLVGTALVTYLVRHVGLHFSTPTARRLARYGLPLVATQVATFVATFGDRYFLNRHADMTTVGLYALSYQFGFLLGMVGSMPVDLVWEPIRFAMAGRPDADRVLARAFVYLNLLLVSAALGITLFVADVLELMTSPAFYRAAHLVPIILVAYVLQGWTTMQDIGIHLKERTELVALCNYVAAGIAVVGYWLLIPRMLGLGAAIATVAAFAARWMMILALSQRLRRVRYQWRPIARILALAGTTALVGAALPHPGLLASLGIRAALFAAYLVGIWKSGVLTPAERATVLRVVAGLRTRWRALRLSRSPA